MRKFYVAVDEDGTNMFFVGNPKRCHLTQTSIWGLATDAYILEKGAIKKEIGRELTWADKPVRVDLHFTEHNK